MPRLHLFEFEDQEWFPETIRNGITDFLQFAVSVSDLYRPFAHRLESAVRITQASRIIDLCSGGGGPWIELEKHVEIIRERQIPILLTDYYPNEEAFRGINDRPDSNVRAALQSVSAMDVPNDLKGFRTLFSSFHHFKPADASSILEDAVRKGQGIAIAESTQRHPLLILYMLIVPLIVLLATPFIKPFRLSRLFWTYLLPLIPLAVMFDGIVSCLRTYSPDELIGLVRNIDKSNSYHWEAGVEKVFGLPVGVVYLIGFPRASNV